MHFGFCIIGIVSGFIWTNKCTGASPTVTLTASGSPYFDIGGSISLTCAINQDVGITSANLNKDRIAPYGWIQINGPSSCVFFKQISADPHVYSITCEQRMTVHIVMNGTNAADHNATWSCYMSAESGICNNPSCNSISSVTTAQRVPVSSVQLRDGTGQLLVTPVPVLEGSNKEFRCDTSPYGSRPRALFNWYQRSQNQSPVLIQGQSVSTPSPKPGVDLSISTSYSTLTLMGSRSYQNMYIYCEARDETNRGNFSRSREAQLNIVYPPVVQLLPNASVFNVTEGSPKFVLTCYVTDANPIPQPDGYSWFLGGIVIQGQTKSSYELLNVQKSQDGVYQCMARNGYGTGNSSTIDLNVQYAPIVKLQAAVRDVNPYRVKQGHENVVLVCEVVDAYPQPTLFVWTHNGNEIQNGSRSTFTIPVAIRQTNGKWACKGINGYGTPIESQLQVDVQYGPVIEPIGNKTVIEGQMLSVTCNIDSNPLALSVSWTKDNNTMFSSPTAMLTINNVSRYDSGTYKCTAVNQIHPSGQNEESLNGMEWFYLNVQYGAEIINLSVPDCNIVNENTTATLRCIVDSNPESNITWTRQGIMGTLQTNLFVHESQLIIEHAECLDTDNYTCNARNGLGYPVERKVPFYVTCYPRTDFRSPPVTKVYSKWHGNASLNYTVISFPEPTFNWSFIGNGSENRWLPDSATKYDNGLQSVLMFNDLNISDFGFYKVIARNVFPTSAVEVFQMIPADVPDAPSNVTVTYIKQTSLTVQWVAGYNGGLEQTFHIMISAGDITRSVYVPDPGYGKFGTQTIEELIPSTEYSISMSATNFMGSSRVTNVIIQIALKVESTSKSLIPAIAGGTSAGLAVILFLGIGIFLWRKLQHKKQTEHVTKDLVMRQLEESPNSQLNAKSVRRDTASEPEYEGLHITDTESSQYMQLNGITLEEHRNASIRSPESNSYEKLHTNANNDIQMYSSLKIPKTSKDSKQMYENTWIKTTDLTTEYQ